MHTFRLIIAFVKVSLQTALAYRADTLINILINLMWLGWELLSLNIIFSNTSSLGGWVLGDLLALLGVFRLVNTLMAAVLWPATEKFNAGVRDGSLDYTLLQPANSLLLISVSRIVVWRIWDLLLGVILLATGIAMSGRGVNPAGLIGFTVLLISGMTIFFSLWVVMISATFWFVKFDNNVTILQALLEAGRYPSTIYPTWLRLIVTFVVPIAVATTVPLQALRGDLSPWQVLLYLVVGAVALIASQRIWKAGVRRYSGASS